MQGFPDRGLFRTLCLLSTKTLTDLPEIWYKCTYIPRILFNTNCGFLHNWVYICIKLCLHTSQKCSPNFITWSRKEIRTSQKILGLMQNTRHHKFTYFFKYQSLKCSVFGLCKLSFIKLHTHWFPNLLATKRYQVF